MTSAEKKRERDLWVLFLLSVKRERRWLSQYNKGKIAQFSYSFICYSLSLVILFISLFLSVCPSVCFFLSFCLFKSDPFVGWERERDYWLSQYKTGENCSIFSFIYLSLTILGNSLYIFLSVWLSVCMYLSSCHFKSNPFVG